MGMFKDMKDAFGVVRSDELKELKRKADAQPKVSMLDGVKAANQAMDQAQMLQQQVGGMNFADPAAAASLYGHGLQGNARVNAISDTGQQVNGAPIMELDLTVTIEGREPYPVRHRQLIAQQAMGNFQPGKMFPVRVDLNDPTKLIIG